MSLGKILIMCTGPFSYTAPFMARYYDKVYYHRVSGGPYRKSPVTHIGEGLPGVTWVGEDQITNKGGSKLWDIANSVDVVWFTDVGNIFTQMAMKATGIPVCASLGGAKMELEKAYFYDQIAALGLPVRKMYRAEGLTDLWEHVKDKDGPLFTKNADPERGDWETTPFINRWEFKKYLEMKRDELGESAELIEILVQQKIEAVCEFGLDTFRQGGQICKRVCGGYEDKDEAIVECLFDEVPEIMGKIVEKQAPVYDNLGYAAPWSNEVRIKESGTAYTNDDTCRTASPPTASLLMMLGEEYAKAIKTLAHGGLPEIKNEDYKYAAELVMSSHYHQQNELHVGSVKEVEQLGIFAKNSISKDGQIYCVPNGDDGIFGSIVSCHKKSWEAAVADVLEKAGQLKIRMLDCDLHAFDRIGEKIKAGEAHGIHF